LKDAYRFLKDLMTTPLNQDLANNQGVQAALSQMNINPKNVHDLQQQMSSLAHIPSLSQMSPTSFSSYSSQQLQGFPALQSFSQSVNSAK